MKVRTRIAPSPTGEYHIGHLRTVLYDYALAKKYNGQFVVRIEDTDQTRFIEGATERILDVTRSYGFSWDEGPDIGGPFEPYYQSKRLDLYKKHALQLVASGHAYYCFCDKHRLETLKKLPFSKYDKHCLSLSKQEVEAKLAFNDPFVIRLNVPANEKIKFSDAVMGEIEFDSNSIDDTVLIKSDGFPTYHMAVVVDDHYMDITHIMRGSDWLSSAPKHVLLYRAFNWTMPVHAHLPNLKEKNSTKKLSKRSGAFAANDFLKEGYLPEALNNFCMFLGWNPGTEKEIYSLQEFIQDFSIEKIHTTDLVVFDRDKLLWLNGYYIRQLSIDDLYEKIVVWANKFSVDVYLTIASESNYKHILSLIQERLKTFNELPKLLGYFFIDVNLDKSLLLSQTQNDKDKSLFILQEFSKLLEAQNDWSVTCLDDCCHNLVKQLNLKNKEAFMTIRVAVTGETSTPPLFDVLNVIGKEKVLVRLNNASAQLF